MLSELVPDDTPDYMVQAWVDCMMWTIGQPGAIDQFRADTGCQWTPGLNGIARAIDEATGADKAAIAAFVKWFNVHVWGPIDGADDFTLD